LQACNDPNVADNTSVLRGAGNLEFMWVLRQPSVTTPVNRQTSAQHELQPIAAVIDHTKALCVVLVDNEVQSEPLY
jgi:hypothetical protein